MVDRFFKYGVFRLMPKNCSTEITVKEFYHHVVKLFRILTDIESDHGARFIRRLWTYLFNIMGTELKFSTDR